MRFTVPVMLAALSTLCACGGGSSPVSAPPTVSLDASSTTIDAGNSTTLTWSSANATSCSASGAWSGIMAASGSRSTGALGNDATFALTCAGAGGTSPPARVTIIVNDAPTAALSASPTSVAAGGASRLTWSSTHATACLASGGWSGPLAPSGTRATGAVSSRTTYTLTCSGAGGTSAPATATVNLIPSATVMSVAPTVAAITLTRSQQFTATVPGGGAAAWTVDGIAGGNTGVGTIDSTGLYTAGGAGVHSIVATSVANTAQTASATVAVTDLPGVYTRHNDSSRDGVNAREYALTTANVAASFGKLASCAVDGAIYAQPLWVANVTLGGTRHNVVFVATQHDSLFAFDADSTACTRLWMVSLIDAAHGATPGETPLPSIAGDALVGANFGDIQPEIGVTGTPVIDPSTGILYVVSKSVGPTQTLFYQRLHAIDITTGNEETGSPVNIAATVPGTGSGGSTVIFSAQQENQRPGLALANGAVYVGWSSHEDKSPWYGWLMAYQYDGTAFTQIAAFNTTPNTQDGGVWMAGEAPAVDSAGNLYVSTGNGNFDASSLTPPNNDYGDSLLQLTASLVVNQYFTPSDEANLYATDGDFGSGGAAVLADLPAGNTVTHALVCGGKDGSLYVLNRDLLGGFGDVFAVQKIALGNGLFSTAALWNNNLYVAAAGGALQAYQLTPSSVQFSLTSLSAHVYGWPGATPSVSASGTQNGLVWALDNSSYCTNQSPSCGPAVLHAYDATDLATELWNSSTNPQDAAGYAVKFTVPTVANGRVYVGTRGNNTGGIDSSTSTPGELEIYGLK